MKAKLIKIRNGYDLYYGNKMIGSTFPYQTISLLSLKNCKAIERGYDLDELAEKCADQYADRFDYTDGHGNREVYSNRDEIEKVYTIAFQKALELMGDKKFSEEDMLRAYNQGGNDGALYVSSCEDYGSYEQIKKSQKESEQREKEFIQSLRQTEWDVELVQEQGKDTFGNAELTWYNSKLDADGCLILKRAE